MERLLRVKAPPTGAKFYDVYHGVELKPRMDDKDALLSFAIEPNGYGAVLQLGGAPTPAQQSLLAKNARNDADTARELQSRLALSAAGAR